MDTWVFGLVAWYMVGLVVVWQVIRWRTELRSMVIEQALKFTKGAQLAYWWYLMLMATGWPVVLWAAYRRHKKYGKEEGPLGGGAGLPAMEVLPAPKKPTKQKSTLKKGQLNQLRNEVRSKGKVAVLRDMRAGLRDSGQRYIRTFRKEFGHEPTIDQVLTDWDASPQEFLDFCAGIGLTRQDLVAMCLNLGAVKGGN